MKKSPSAQKNGIYSPKAKNPNNMIIAALYSHNGGRELLESHYAAQLNEVKTFIATVDAEAHRTKISQEKTMMSKVLYNPPTLNQALKSEFAKQGWKNHKESCDYPTQYYTPGYKPRVEPKRAFRDMDFVKDRVGVEVQFGKYAFAIYNVCAKMTIFHKLNVIDVGIEIVPIRDLVDEMSTGIIYFEQFVWDLEQRGVSNIDLPVLIIGVAAKYNPENTVAEEITLRDPDADEAV
jgi:hypothetical protein